MAKDPCHTLFICGRSPPRQTVPNACATCEKNDASRQLTGQIVRSGPCFGAHRGVGNRLDASRQGARRVQRAAVRRHLWRCMRQGPVVRTGSGEVCLPNRTAIRRPARDMRDDSKTLHCPQAQQEFSTGLRLQQQNLFQRLLPPRLPGCKIPRWQVLMHMRPTAGCDPLFRHIIAYKLPRSCFAGAGLPARAKAR
jgi:hypothetical protein